MAGKYAHIVDRLPKLLPADARYQEKVQEVKRLILAEAEVEFLSVAALTQDYITMRGEVDAAEEALKKANLRLEAICQMLTDAYETEDVTSMKVTGGTVRVQIEPYAQVKDKELFRKWCVEACQACGMMRSQHVGGSEQTQDVADAAVRKASELLNLHPDHAPVTLEAQLQLWPATMNSITKERLLKGYPEPPGVEAFQKPKVVLTRDKE